MRIKYLKIISSIMFIMMLLILITRNFLRDLLTEKMYLFSFYAGALVMFCFIGLEVFIYIKKRNVK